MSMSTAEKTRETRLRRMAQRQGLQLVKSRRRDPRATDYGTYVLADENNVLVVWGGLYLDDIERALNEDR
jgi:hypothetical protein